MQEEKQFLFEEELTDFIYRTIFTVIISLFTFFEIYNAVDQELITRGNIFTVIMISISFNALLLLYRKVKIYLIPAFAVVGLIMYLSIDRDDVRIILESAVFSIFLISLAAFVLFQICDRFAVLNIIAAGGLLIYMISELIFDFYMYPASPALALFYILAALARLMRNGLKKTAVRKVTDLTSENENHNDSTGVSISTGIEGNNNERSGRTRRYITYLLPFMLALMLLLLIIPKPERPISWKWVSNIYEYTSEKLTTLFHRISDRFGKAETDSFRISFSIDDRMTYNNKRKNLTDLFEVTPDGTIFGSMYLKGAVFNEFRNGEWFNTLENDRDYTRIDAFETRLGVENFEGASVNSLLRENKANIHVLDISTPVVFSPAKMITFSDISVKKKTQAVNEYLLFAKNAPYGSEYTVSFLQMNIGNTVFTDYMNSPEETDDLDEFEIVKRNFQGKYYGLTYEDLLEYRKYVEYNYTSAPQLQDTVKNWIEAVWKDAGGGEELSGYEKLTALERALSGFKYELNVDDLPGYVETEGDFVNYFILEKREGYCVHYATLFCLLARYLGYPARVVQGYKVYAEMNTPATVTNGSGHAWPEVYFKGKGWIPFEPTPGMYAERYAGWAVKSGKLTNTDFFHQNRTEEETILPDEAEFEREHRENYASGVLIIAIVGIVLLSIILLITVRILLNRRRVKRMNEVEHFLLEFKMIQQVLAQFGIRKEISETLSEFCERAEEELAECLNGDAEELSKSMKTYDENLVKHTNTDDEEIIKSINKADGKTSDVIRGKTQTAGISEKGSDSGLSGCIESYENYIYGGRLPEKSETLALRNCREDLEKLMKEYFGKKYWLHKLKLIIERNVR
ncbi:MAG: transglutaminase domain-containing protein [Lachnospiraceae bacterium]|nr:transglutaminase domain-containing protein [Lachnospiraceae bacterium]